MDPVGVAVEILDGVQRPAQGHQRESLAYAFVNLDLVVARQQRLGLLQQVAENIVKIRIALKLAIQVIEMQKKRGSTDLRIIGLVLIQPWNCKRPALDRVLGNGSEKVRREVPELQELPGVLREPELLADLAAALRMPVRIEREQGRTKQRRQHQQGRTVTNIGMRHLTSYEHTPSRAGRGLPEVPRGRGW